MSHRDREPRFEVAWRARLRCREWHDAFRVATANVSRGGAFFASARTPAVGARVEVALELPDASTVTLTGLCVHVRTPEQARAQGRAPGFGMRFDDAPGGDLARLEALAQAAGVPVEVRDDERDRGGGEPLRGAPLPLPESPSVRLGPGPPRGGRR
jgi:Tfp pilus assembly protein PilZ